MSEESGYLQIDEATRRKAEVFFAKAQTVANAAQFDFAIEMYLQGLYLDPENIDAHRALRDISLKRKASGGKDLGMLEKRVKMRYGKDDKANMLVAEKFLAYDPGNTGRMLELLQAAQKIGCYDTVMWIGPILLKANIDSGKPELSKFQALKDAYIQLKQWQHATDAAQRALQMRPDDMNMQNEVKNLAAQQTMHAGGYASGKSFRDSVRDMDTQKKLMTEDTDVRTVDVLRQQIQLARQEYQREPNEPGKINKLVDTLAKTEDVEYENEAMTVLEEAYERTRQFRFRARLGQIKMAQLKRMGRSLREDVAKNPQDAEAVKVYREFLRDQAEEELKEYALAAEAYPTDTTLKYEMAKRLILLTRYPDAIPLLQQSVQDPKLRVDASIELGKAFLEADFVDEAVDTLRGLAESYQIAGDAKSKEIYYWYGRSLEKQNSLPDAIKCYSRVTQWDFNYRDVQQRIKGLRAKAAGA